MADSMEIVVRSKRPSYGNLMLPSTQLAGGGNLKPAGGGYSYGGGYSQDLAGQMMWRSLQDAAKTAVSQYSNLTGDFIIGEKLQKVATIAAAMTGLFLLGSNPIGWIALGTSAVNSGINEYVDYVKSETELRRMRERSGLFINGGRGTSE